MISHLLWVCGPGGGGKSTFLRQLAAGKLPAYIHDQLPAGCERWPQLTARNLHFMDIAQTTLPSHFAVHYSLTQSLRHFLSFENDPLLRIFKLASDLTIIHVKPSEDRLARQRLHRRTYRQQRRQQRKDRRPSVRDALKAAMSLRSDRLRARVARLMRMRSAAASREDRWEARKRIAPRCDEHARYLYQTWEEYLHQEICHDRSITELFIQPDPNSVPGEVGWVPATCSRQSDGH